LYKLIFGLDVIGNPIAIARGFTEGVSSVIFEPLSGLQKGGPDQFFEGVRVGTSNFTSRAIGYFLFLSSIIGLLINKNIFLVRWYCWRPIQGNRNSRRWLRETHF